MIFEQENIVFQILDIFYLEHGCAKTRNFNRNFDALSYRYETDTVIESNGKVTELIDNTICYFPSETNYTRTTKRDKLIVVHFKSFNYHSNEIEYFIPENHEKYVRLFEKILDCWRKKAVSYKHEASAILNNIFAEFYKDNFPAHNSHSKIYPSMQYIDGNYLKKDFSLRTAAEKSLMSDTYFRKLFKKEFDVSPKKYIINLRIRHAESLIMTGYFTLQEIAEKCGYEDYKHFSAEFKKITGLSPSKYKYNFMLQ